MPHSNLSKYSPNYIEDGLTSHYVNIRSLYFYNEDFRLTPKQIERGLKDDYTQVRLAVASREDFIPTVAQFERGIRDASPAVSNVFRRRESAWTRTRLASLLNTPKEVTSSRKPPTPL
jgi:hypothetical protein